MKKQTPKLTIRREAIRELTDHQLNRVTGGGIISTNLGSTGPTATRGAQSTASTSASSNHSGCGL